MMFSPMVLHEMFLIDHIVAIVICVLAPVLAISSRRMAVEDMELEADEKIKLYHSNALLLFVFSLVVITIWRFPGGRSMAELGFAWPHWNNTILLLLVAIVLFYALDIFFQYGFRRWREKSLHRRSGTMTFVPTNQTELFHFLFLALAAGIGEEIIFRGYLIQYVLFWTGNNLAGTISACLFASALFAFLHGYQGYRSMVKIFFLAILFSAVFVLSQSLLFVVIIHTLIDILSGWIGIYLLRQFPQEEHPENETEG
jgi:membrane protease YdiL (CAAX protease family)